MVGCTADGLHQDHTWRRDVPPGTARVGSAAEQSTVLIAHVTFVNAETTASVSSDTSTHRSHTGIIRPKLRLAWSAPSLVLRWGYCVHDSTLWPLRAKGNETECFTSAISTTSALLSWKSSEKKRWCVKRKTLKELMKIISSKSLFLSQLKEMLHESLLVA